MEEIFNQALLIMAIGMGLVFIVILLLWGMMALLVKFVRDKPEFEGAEPEMPIATAEPAQRMDHKHMAAALAVSVALMQRSSSLRLQAGARPASQTNNWQSVLRAAQRSQRNQLFTRK
jgi:Na+-transporting methylmalonyl-CoA/oxaloacetate decarboxylase gamma subunit